MNSAPKIAFLMPGQGSLHPGILQELAHQHVSIRELIERADPLTQRYFGRPLSDCLRLGNLDADPAEAAPFYAFPLNQIVIFLVDLGLCNVLLAGGVVPSVIVGHSLGELAALTAAGILDFLTGLELVCERTQALVRCQSAGQIAGQIAGQMLALGCDARKTALLLELGARPELASLTIAAENAPNQTLLAGPAAAVARLASLAEMLAIPAQILDAAFPFHTALMQPAREQFRAAIARPKLHPSTARVFSPISMTDYCATADSSDAFADQIADQLTRPVRFQAAVQQLYDEGFRVFIEVGGRHALSTLTSACLSSTTDAAVLATSQQQVSILARYGRPALAAPLRDSLDRMPTPDLLKTVTELIAELSRRLNSPSTNGSSPLSLRRAQQSETASVQQRIIAIYQEATEYPPEVFELDIDLEAELGIDSLKQMEILGKVRLAFALPKRDELRIRDYNTIGKVIALVLHGEQRLAS